MSNGREKRFRALMKQETVAQLPEEQERQDE
jgi:hypothetical protein